MTKAVPETDPPPKYVEELTTQYLRIQPVGAAKRMWERLLTQEDRKKLGGNLSEAYRRLGTVGMWIELRGGSQERAIAEVGHGIGFLSDATFEWLLREIGEGPRRKPKAADERELPSWNRETGELRFKRRVIRKLRLIAKPSNIQRILDAFEEDGWPLRIDSPVPGGQQRLHLTLQSLNRRLKAIRFSSQEGGRAVCWSPR